MNPFRKYQILEYEISQSDSEFVVNNSDSHEGKFKVLFIVVEFPRKNGHGYAEFFFQNSTGLR
ncbi:hypothetical protein BUQ74_13195 [Leptospira weilii serovar Heyan]|uniref:Uncharacterized protein n=1 Tax=Leptospira weilii str. UI 13098 TaxID=1088542 RepID=M6QFS7_9LEPT|nr:hypothetical protein LEP1GSC108_3307 [Leptospira weilii str. UI 13098]OMI16886.1 hypothetical protein BUQ74_13195 [Leptospira weilii serovar Heyan]